MAELKVFGVDTTTGEEKLSSPGDTFVGSVPVPETVPDRKAAVVGIPLQNAGSTVLLVVPALKRFVCTMLLLECTSAAAPSNLPSVRVGDQALTVAECVPLSDVVGLDAVGEAFLFVPKGKVNPVAAGATVELEVVNPANDTLVVTAHLFGLYI